MYGTLRANGDICAATILDFPFRSMPANGDFINTKYVEPCMETNRALVICIGEIYSVKLVSDFVTNGSVNQFCFFLIK